ncbi:MAG: hypothetical protein H6883_07025 [Rhodobiaceae bacterium]|nr:hypothetical protein [Rhodobiaceae bacterium]MCC0055872.1 hypothetical protein [Rhodobiaceae bacterium]
MSAEGRAHADDARRAADQRGKQCPRCADTRQITACTFAEHCNCPSGSVCTRAMTIDCPVCRPAPAMTRQQRLTTIAIHLADVNRAVESLGRQIARMVEEENRRDG